MGWPIVAPVDLLAKAYQPLLALADGIDEPTGWRATRLPGWCVRDLLFHLAGDCQRALVALATPAAGAADADEISYWSRWRPGSDAALAGLRGTRIMSSVWTSVRGPAALYEDTARAVLVAAGRADAAEVVETQGHRLTVGALLSTLAVEAGVHQLDLGDALSAPPAPEVLGEIRRVLDGLLGTPAPATWSDERYVRVGTGRAELTDAERDDLGASGARFPLFG